MATDASITAAARSGAHRANSAYEGHTRAGEPIATFGKIGKPSPSPLVSSTNSGVQVYRKEFILDCQPVVAGDDGLSRAGS